jgi:hypothetical protein
VSVTLKTGACSCRTRTIDLQGCLQELSVSEVQAKSLPMFTSQNFRRAEVHAGRQTEELHFLARVAHELVRDKVELTRRRSHKNPVREDAVDATSGDHNPVSRSRCRQRRPCSSLGSTKTAWFELKFKQAASSTRSWSRPRLHPPVRVAFDLEQTGGVRCQRSRTQGSDRASVVRGQCHEMLQLFDDAGPTSATSSSAITKKKKPRFNFYCQV